MDSTFSQDVLRRPFGPWYRLYHPRHPLVLQLSKSFVRDLYLQRLRRQLEQLRYQD